MLILQIIKATSRRNSGLMKIKEEKSKNQILKILNQFLKIKITKKTNNL